MKRLLLTTLFVCEVAAQTLTVGTPFLANTGTNKGSPLWTPTYISHPDATSARLGNLMWYSDGQNVDLFDCNNADCSNRTHHSGDGISGGGWPIRTLAFWSALSGHTIIDIREPQARLVPSHTMGITNAASVTDPENRIMFMAALNGSPGAGTGPWLAISADTTHAADLSTWQAVSLCTSECIADASPVPGFNMGQGVVVPFVGTVADHWWSCFKWSDILFAGGSTATVTKTFGPVTPDFTALDIPTTSYDVSNTDPVFTFGARFMDVSNGNAMSWDVHRFTQSGGVWSCNGNTSTCAQHPPTFVSGQTYYMTSVNGGPTNVSIMPAPSSTGTRCQDDHSWMVWQQGGENWIGSKTMQDSSGTQPCMFWWFKISSLNLSLGRSVLDDSGNTGTGSAFYDTSIGVDNAGNMYLTGTHSDTSTYDEVVVYWRASTDVAGTVRGPVVVQPGTGTFGCSGATIGGISGQLGNLSGGVQEDGRFDHVIAVGQAQTVNAVAGTSTSCAWQWYEFELSVTNNGNSGGVPAIMPGGITPIYSTSNIIQPGSWVSIYGSNLAASPATWAGDFPTNLGGTSVTINGKPGYLWYVSPGQINLQAPDDTTTGPVTVTVTTQVGSASSTVTLGAFGPSFTLLDAKHVSGIILRNNGSGAYGGGTYDILGPTGSSLGYPTVAARPGDSVVLFAVGLGPTSPPVAAGSPFTGSAATTNPVAVSINNVPVALSFAGLSSAGLYQINVTIPAGLGTGDVSLAASVGGAQTQPGVVISLQ
jgi:uncharacterized protein (TIGR03437 family)